MTKTLLPLTLFVALVVPAVFPSASLAQGRLTIHVAHENDDAVGQAVAHALREQLRRSAGYTLVPRQEDALFVVYLGTMSIYGHSLDPAVRQYGRYASALSLSLTVTNLLPLDRTDPQTWLPIFVYSQVGVTGSDGVDEIAKDFLVSLDRSIQTYLAQIGTRATAAPSRLAV